MLKTSQLEILVALSETGSINKAAEILYTSQPHISRCLKQIEEEMGKKLFTRTNTGVQLTREGKYVCAHARSILAQLRVLEQVKSSEIDKLEATLNIAVYALFIKEKLFLDFKNSCVSTSTTLNVYENTLENALNAVSHGVCELGIAVIIDAEMPSLRSIVNTKGLQLEVLSSDYLYVHIGPQHNAYKKESLSIEDLTQSIYLHLPFDKYSATRLGIQLESFKVKDFHNTFTVNNYHLIPYFLQFTDSFLLGNKWQWDFLSTKEIKTVRIDNCDLKTHLVLFTKKRLTLSAEAEKFLHLLQLYYRDYNTPLNKAQ